MSIGGIKSLGSIDPRSAYGIGGVADKAGPSFSQQLQQAIQNVDKMNDVRETAVEDMVAGKATEVHDVMIAAKEAQMAFELLLEVRNKLLESYQEIMRMNV